METVKTRAARFCIHAYRAAALAAVGSALFAAGPAIRMETDSTGYAVIRVEGGKAEGARFALYVESAEAGMPPMAGSFRTEGDDLIFSPRFPLRPGLRYRAVWKAEPEIAAVFEVPAAKATPPVYVTQVYPTADVLPENQLKFYIHFSGAMTQGDSYRWIRLLRDDGSEIEAPFLMLGEELWDPGGQRFTLYFNPGRVKTGLVPNREMGTPLRAGQRFTLEIDRGWRDAQGRELRESHRKAFRVGPQDRTPPDPKRWKLLPPASGGVEALEIAFPEPMEHALSERLIQVMGPDGRAMTGAAEVCEQETRWRFTPREAWKAGRHTVRVETTLEDLAGNRIGRRFEVDLMKENPRPRPEAVTIPFMVTR